MKNDNVFRMLGLAAKAGKVASGEFMTENAVKSDRAALVIVAEDASENTKKKFTNMCEYYKVPVRIHGIKDELGHFIGKEFRASLAITDKGLAQAVMKKMN
ncbi:MAG TPA: 50S ribosomal protein L7ae [Lachnospiraceae bacterium]|nr:50S ribosomal protein L7ae [Lachnospiraceae bacterium]